MRSYRFAWFTIVVAFVLVACASATTPTNPNVTPTPSQPAPGPLATEPESTQPAFTAIPLDPTFILTPESIMTPTPEIETGLEPLIAEARADLAARLSINPNAIQIISAQTVVWPDRSLGCPQPGMAYIQVLAEGYRIELRVEGQTYSYHGGEGRGPFLCENSSK